MPSSSTVRLLSVDDEGESSDGMHGTAPDSPPKSTVSERLKGALKLIPSYPGREKPVRSIGESSGLTIQTDADRVHGYEKAEIENCTTTATQADFRSFFRDHVIIMEL